MNSSRSWRNCRFSLRLLLLLKALLRGRILDAAPNTNRCPATTGVRRLLSGLLEVLEVVEVDDSSSLRLRICADSKVVVLVDGATTGTSAAVSFCFMDEC